MSQRLQPDLLSRITAAALCGLLVLPVTLGAQQVNSAGGYVMKVQSELVLTNVIVRDKKTGEVVKGLKASDFTILENNKPQKVETFDFENVDQFVQQQPQTTVSGEFDRHGAAE